MTRCVIATVCALFGGVSIKDVVMENDKQSWRLLSLIGRVSGLFVCVLRKDNSVNIGFRFVRVLKMKCTYVELKRNTGKVVMELY